MLIVSRIGMGNPPGKNNPSNPGPGKRSRVKILVLLCVETICVLVAIIIIFYVHAYYGGEICSFASAQFFLMQPLQLFRSGVS